jgi:hypothetical protein
MQPNTHICKNCGNSFSGKFCNNCGEKVYAEHDRKIGHLIEEGFHFITHFEGSFFTTIRTILTKPGKLSADYCAGIRKKYFKPVSLFLLLVVIYLLFPFFKGLNMNYYTYVSPDWQYSSIGIPVAKKKMSTHHLKEEELAVKYNSKSASFTKLFIFLLIPLSGFLLALLFFNSKKYIFDHFILAIEIICFIILTVFLFIPLLAYIALTISPSTESFFQDGGLFAFLIYALMAIYVSVAFRNFYKQKKWISWAKGITFWLVYLFGIQYVYRILLYLLIMLFI